MAETPSIPRGDVSPRSVSCDLTQSAGAEFSATPSRISLPALALGDPRQQQAGRWLLMASVVCGLVMMLPGLTGSPLILDEHGTYWISGDENPADLWTRSLRYENIPPLSPLIRSCFLSLFGKSEFVFRLPSVIFFLLAIPVVFWLGRDLSGPVVGGLAAFMTAWHPNVLGEIRLARCYSLTVLLSAMFFWVTVRWILTPNRIRYAALWSLLASALIWTHYLNLAVVIAVIPVLAWELMAEAVRVRLALTAAVLSAATAGIPLVGPLLRMSVWGESFGYEAESPLLRIASPMWWAGFPAGLASAWLIDRMTTRNPGAILIRVPRQHVRMLSIWGILPTVVVAIVCRGGLSSLANPRYRIGFELASCLLLVVLVARRRTFRSAWVGVVVAIVVSWSCAQRLPWAPFRLNSERAGQWKQLAQHIQTHGIAGESVFAQSGLGEGFLVADLYEDRVFMDYAACRLGRFYLTAEHPRYALPFLWQPGLPVFDYYRDLVGRVRNSDTPRIWIASATDTDLNQRSLQTARGLMKRCRYSVSDSLVLNDCILLECEPIR